MRIVFPKNLYSTLLAEMLPEQLRSSITFKESSVISSDLEQGSFDLALIPSCDMIRHESFFISGRTGISFDGILSNSFLYFLPGQTDIPDLYMAGDISVNEIVLTKILFKERYNADVQLHLETGKIDRANKNYLVAGDMNLSGNMFRDGLSLSDELSTMLYLPYVNFIIVSKHEEMVSEFNSLAGELDIKMEQDINKIITGMDISAEAKDYVLDNFNSVYFDMTEVEADGLRDLLQMPYFHGITDEMLDLKIVT